MSKLRFVTPRMHAPVDYIIVALFALAPMLFVFGGIAANLCYGIAIAYLAMSLTTAYPLGAVKLIPFPVHGYIELVLAPLLVATPWIFGFQNLQPAMIFFIAMGVAELVAFVVTDYQLAETDPRQRRMTDAGPREARPA